jgi:diacylglycerol kinase
VAAHYWEEGLLMLVEVVNSQVESMLAVDVIFEEVRQMLVVGEDW